MEDGFVHHDTQTISSCFQSGFSLRVITDEEDSSLSCLFIIIFFESIGSNITMKDNPFLQFLLCDHPGILAIEEFLGAIFLCTGGNNNDPVVNLFDLISI